MKRMKRFLAFALLLGSLMVLAACGGAKQKDVPVSELSAAVASALGKADSMTSSDAMLLGLTKKTAAELGDHAVLMNVYGTSADEFGVFKAGTMTAKDLQATAEDYLAKRIASWMDEYMPQEKPKLTNAEVKVSGDYVMYAILSDEDKATAFSAFENALK